MYRRQLQLLLLLLLLQGHDHGLCVVLAAVLLVI
jgi:hypothetical protein